MLEHIWSTLCGAKNKKECVRKDGLGKKTTKRSNPSKEKEPFLLPKGLVQ